MHCHITILRYLAILRIVLDIRGFVSVGLLHNAGLVIKTNVSQLKLLTFLTQFKLVTLSHGPAQQCTSEEKQEIWCHFMIKYVSVSIGVKTQSQYQCIYLMFCISSFVTIWYYINVRFVLPPPVVGLDVRWKDVDIISYFIYVNTHSLCRVQHEQPTMIFC